MTTDTTPIPTPETATMTTVTYTTADLDGADLSTLRALADRLGVQYSRGDDAGDLRALLAPAATAAVEVVEETVEVVEPAAEETVDVETIEVKVEPAPTKPRKPRKSRGLDPAVKAANAAARKAKRAQAKVDREKKKIDNAISVLTDLKIAPTDDYKVRVRGVMRAAHAIARLAVDAGSTLPYRKEMGGAMRALWGRLKAKETILGLDYLDALTSPQKEPEPVKPVIDLDAMTVPDDDDDYEGIRLDDLIPAA